MGDRPEFSTWKHTDDSNSEKRRGCRRIAAPIVKKKTNWYTIETTLGIKKKFQTETVGQGKNAGGEGRIQTRSKINDRVQRARKALEGENKKKDS